MEDKSREIASYYDWAKEVCAEKNITLDGKITQVKDAKLFCISSSIGDLYLKKTTSFITDELTFTHKLMESGIISIPEWVGYDHDMKVCLMRDMGGSDLSSLPSLDMETSIQMFVSLSRIQKDSVQYVKSEGFCGFDYRIGTMLEEMRELPESACKMLYGTQYSLTREETEKLKRNTEYAGTGIGIDRRTDSPRHDSSWRSGGIQCQGRGWKMYLLRLGLRGRITPVFRCIPLVIFNKREAPV